MTWLLFWVFDPPVDFAILWNSDGLTRIVWLVILSLPVYGLWRIW